MKQLSLVRMALLGIKGRLSRVTGDPALKITAMRNRCVIGAKVTPDPMTPDPT